MGLFNRLLRRPARQFSFAVGAEDPPKNPQDKLGDPLSALTPEGIDRDYRNRVNRGELAIPTWALHEALRLTPQLLNYQGLWIDALAGMDYSIKTVPDPDKPEGSKDVTEHEKRADAHAAALRKAYEAMDVPGVVGHLALANLYGFSVLAKRGARLEPLNWWNFARVGLFGEWKWNPLLRVQDGRSLPDEWRINPDDYVIREAEQNCLLVYLRLYLRFREVEGYWDNNLEKESKRQVVIIPGDGLDEEEMAEFKETAVKIAKGGSGSLAAGHGERATQVLFPPESRGLPYYENRLKMLDELACKTLFGAPLIANSAPDSGTLAGNAHSDTAAKRIQGAAMEISAAMQKQCDRWILERDGLLEEGGTPLAYFELVDRKAVDPQKEIEWTAALKPAGWDRDADELSERTGMRLSKAEVPSQPPAPPPLWNRGDLLNFDPSQTRDGDGQWSESGGGSAPKRISSGEADAILEKGVTERAADGKQVHFGQRLKQKLESDPAYSGRKELLGWGREAVRSGHYTSQTVKGEPRDYYAKVFQSEGKGVLVIVDAKDGEAFNLFAAEERYLKRGKYVNRTNERAEPGEQPPDGVLQDLAAAGILPDWFEGTTPAELVNRASGELGVPASWLEPVRGLLADLAEKAEGGMSDEELARYAEEAARRVPELFEGMDVDAFARLLEGVLGSAALEGVRDALHP